MSAVLVLSKMATMVASSSGGAVRAQLAAMQRDGLVRPAGERKGTRKPSVEYMLDPEAETALSRAYVPFVAALMKVLATHLPRRELERLLHEAGAHAAEGLPRAGDDAGRHPETCIALAALVAELTSLPARETCDRGEHPACRFSVGGSPKAARRPGRGQPST